MYDTDSLPIVIPLNDPLGHPLPLSMAEARPPVRSLDPTSAPFPRLSTYWMPLDEPRQAWATFGADFGTEIDLAATLQATAHAFFALAHETIALQLFNLGAEQEQHRLFAQHAGEWYGQAEQALGEATRHWSRAAYELDVLAASDGLCPQDGLEEARAMSHAARTQQERLWKLTDEVRGTLIIWRNWQQQASVSHQDQKEATR